MSMIKMVGLDLDGTSLNEKSRLSPRTKAAFERAGEMGVHIVVATGRTFSSLPEELKDVKGLKYLITSNGAKITGAQDGKTYYENLIGEKETEKVHNILKPLNASIEFFAEGRAYIGMEDYEKVEKGFFREEVRTYVLTTRTPVEDIYDFLLKNKGRIENINVNFTELEEKPFFAKALSVLDGVTLTSSFPFNIEIGGKTTSKGEALAYLLKQEGLERENLMACGDNPNDIAMIKLAKIGVAMGNADEEVKKIADVIAPPNYEDGVAQMIEKYVFEE